MNFPPITSRDKEIRTTRPRTTSPHCNSDAGVPDRMDRDRMNGVRELEALWAARGRPDEARWLLEELRVSHFAQALGVRGQVSAKKIRQLLQG